jgi:hypothetical protein
MGINIGSVFKGGIKGFVTSGGSPVGAALGAMQETSKERQNRIAEREQQKYLQEQKKMAEIYGTGQNLTSVQAPMAGRSTQQAGFGAGFGQFLTDVGRNIVSPFAGLATQIAPFFGRSVQQQPAVTTTRSAGGQETQGSGSIQAGLPSLLAPGISTIGRFLKTPTGGAIGTGLLGLGASMLADGQPTGMRITRKMKSQARMILNMTGGNISATADILNIDEQTLIMILLKRFRNDGPVVTKAALRKTKQTVRRLKSMCDMYDDLRPRATARRRTPMKRATTTLISNK